jgi:hypothetical protein
VRQLARRVPLLLTLLLLFATPLPTCRGSSGDESRRFRNCLGICQRGVGTSVTGRAAEETGTVQSVVGGCPSRAEGLRSPSLPFWWDCEGECKYRCMWFIEGDKRRHLGEPMAVPEKYYGKWPFVRLGPMQEPASVLLSIANLVANAHCFVKLLAQYQKVVQSSEKKASPGRRELETSRVTLWSMHFLLAINAWMWSAVFHTRDLMPTERLDYFSAGAVMVFDVFVSCSRVLGQSVMRGATVRSATFLLLLGAYIRHMFYMHYIKFDYGYHVGICVAAGVLQSVLWTGWLFSREGRAHPGNRFLWTFVVGVNAAVLLEIFDFPPLWDTIDAHALWHLATVPLTYVLFGFVARDTQQLGARKGQTSTA